MNERTLLHFVERACTANGVTVTALSGGWVLELHKDDQFHRIVGSNFDFNDQAATSLARDKVAASSILDAAHINQIPHLLLKSRDQPTFDLALLSKMFRGGSVVLKPLEGNGGQLVTLAHNDTEVQQIISDNQVPAWAVCPFVDISQEIRLVVKDNAVRLAYAKINPVVVNGLKLFNLNKGAKAKPLLLSELDDSLIELALATMRATGLRFAAVDIVSTPDGTLCVLEINAAFSLTHYAQTNTATFDEVAVFYERIIAEMFR